MVTIKDISKISGYSVTTVSKALNNYSDIGQKTKDKILKIAKDLGYVPNAQARSLVTNKSWTIGVIFDEMTGVGLQHPLFLKILEKFKAEVERQGYDVLLLSKNIGNKNYDSYLEHVRRKQLDAILILAADFESQEVIELIESDIFTVTFDNHNPYTLNVSSNNALGVRKAVKYLYDLGHRKIAHIRGTSSSFIGRERLEAFKDSMKAFGLEVREEYIESGGLFSLEGGYNAMERLMALSDQPTAVFCAGDMLSIGAIKAIKAKGKSCPEDYSIVGFDGLEIGQMIEPILTTVSQDIDKIGQLCAIEILSMIYNKTKKHSGETFHVDTKLIAGDSTKVYIKK